jgi:hypothetical protein
LASLSVATNPFSPANWKVYRANEDRPAAQKLRGLARFEQILRGETPEIP